MAWYNFAAPAGALGGFGLGEVAGGLASAIDAPRRMLWNELFGTESGSELLHNLFGADPESTLTQIGGTGLEMLLDPMNLLGGLGGYKAGRLVGNAGENLAELAAKKAAVASELGAVNRLRQNAVRGVGSLSAAEDAAQAAADTGRSLLANQADVIYNPEVLAELPDVMDLGRRGTMQTYRRVNPAVANEIDALGLGYQTPEGMFTYAKPSFAKGSGGVLQKQGLFPQSPLLESLTGGPVDPFNLEQTLSAARMPRGLPGRPPMPMMSEFMPGGLKGATEFSGYAPGAMGDIGGLQTHLADMNLSRGLGFANERASALRRELLGLEDPNNLSRLESMLMRLGVGG